MGGQPSRDFNDKSGFPETYEIHDFTGGANPSDAPVNNVPEFTGGVNPDNAPVHDVPEFVGSVNPDKASVHDVPEFIGGAGVDDNRTRDVDIPTQGQQKSLPNTNDAEILLALGSALTMIGLAMRRKYGE